MEIVLLLAIIYMLWRWHATVFPEPIRLVSGLARRLRRGLIFLGWSMPKQRGGVAYVLWWWSLAGAGLLSLAWVVALGQGGGAGSLALTLAVGLAWLLVVAGWLIVRWRARQRYTPRPLPTRERRREPWQP